ncbi:prospero homeobox protein 1-like [Sphaeramia orbicularis]|uniref:prospero homeobox protein 1-like n=1 Tax=Sphaeramia orbicularis TaxID=375764 RepID=UPI00117D596B|nr:prospero homeobox protein 1-like [Sphaeramia orbicularis]
MIPNVWSKGMYSSSNFCLEGCTAEHLSSFQLDPMALNSIVPGVSISPHKSSDSPKMLRENAYCSSSDPGSNLMFSNRMELKSTRDQTSGRLSTRSHPSPASNSFCHQNQSLNSGRQAKRARVENIIKCMSDPPGVDCSDVMTNRRSESDAMQENERMHELEKRKLLLDQSELSGVGSVYRDHENLVRSQLQSQDQCSRKLRTKFSPADEVPEAHGHSMEGVAESYTNWSTSSKAFTDSYNEFESSSKSKSQVWKKVKLINYFQSKPEKIKLMADVLKYELSKAVSISIDSIFQSSPLLQMPPKDEDSENIDMSSLNLHKHPLVCLGLSCCGNTEVQVSDVQTEALALVVEKPQLARCDKSILQSGSKTQHRPTPLIIPVDKNQASEISHNSNQNALKCLQDGCFEAGRTKTLDGSWNMLKVRSKVNSRSVRSPGCHSVSVDPILLENLHLPQVKIESNSVVKNNMYMLNEGLTTNHLKKAKLMFFYTRYPSSLVLKMCFHDVQFTRCITSQLIKWFSNFREFYYIQMEKFARHALMEGVSDVRSLTVGRESELFRALNMHYNKANDFQVPERFLEVAEITLREFYIAISVGKDHDPSWKKAIYKVICKLDSDVPAEFKTQQSG